MAPAVIKWSAAEDRKAISTALKKCGGLEGVVGMLDGTYINISAPERDAEVYIHRKCGYGITLQAVCDNNLCFTNCFVGYPSSVNDSRIFRNSHFYKNVLDDPRKYFSEGEYILADKAYPNLIWCIAPYIARIPLSLIQKNFNLCHAKTRQCIERAFALLFGRFRRLKYLDMHRTDLVPATVLAACVLHNLCLDVCDVDIESFIEDGLEFMKTNTDRPASPNSRAHFQEENLEAAEFRNTIAGGLERIIKKN